MAPKDTFWLVSVAPFEGEVMANLGPADAAITKFGVKLLLHPKIAA